MNRAHASVELGVGVRVVKGDQTGYGYTEDLSPRRRSSSAPAPPRPSPTAPRAPARRASTSRPACRTATRSSAPGTRCGPEEKLPLLAALNERAFAADPRVQKVNVYLRDESGAILIADSSGRDRRGHAADDAPLPLASSPRTDGRREQNGYNVAGRAGFEFYTPERLDRVVREAVARTTILFEAGAAARGRDAGRARRGLLRASSSTRRSATAWRPTSTARASRSTPTRSASAIAQPFVNIVDDARQRGRARRHQRGRRGQRRRHDPPRRGRRPRDLPARRDLGAPLRRRAHRQRPARELPPPAAAAHALDLHAARARTGPRRSSAR